MKNIVKSIGRRFLSETTRLFIYQSIPKFQLTNTYLLKRENPIENLHPIADKYRIKEVSIEEDYKLAKLYGDDYSFRKAILPRLSTKDWVALAVEDKTTGSFDTSPG